MEIHPLDISEYHRIIELWHICGLPYKPLGRDTEAKIGMEMERNPEYWKGIYHDQRLVAVVFGTDEGRKGWINRLAVQPEYRGKGLGTSLVKALEKEFYRKGIEIIGVLIEGDNLESMRFFEGLGYEDLDIRYYSKRNSDDS